MLNSSIGSFSHYPHRMSLFFAALLSLEFGDVSIVDDFERVWAIFLDDREAREVLPGTKDVDILIVSTLISALSLV